MHLEEYTDRDIQNSLYHINDNGFILLHDCNPPTEFHQRKNYEVNGKFPDWNGTVWKSIVKLRMNETDITINTVNTDWGVGIIQKKSGNLQLEKKEITYELLENNRKKLLNLISVSEFLKLY